MKKEYFIVERTTVQGNGAVRKAWVAFRKTVFTMLGIFTYMDIEQYTNSETIDQCRSALKDSTERETKKVVEKVTIEFK